MISQIIQTEKPHQSVKQIEFPGCVPLLHTHTYYIV